MTKRRVRIVLVCEDNQHESFVRRFLEKMGWEKREIIPIKAPSAGGSAEQYVRVMTPIELNKYRTRHAATVLISVMDADNKSVEARIGEIEKECENQEVEPRGDEEAVAFIIPKRNIETWIKHLNGGQVNEEEVYTDNKGEKDLCKNAADKLAESCKTNEEAPPGKLPSLEAACREYKKRIKPMA